MNDLALTTFQSKTHRLIKSRFPTVGVWDDLDLTTEEAKLAFQLEEATNSRITLLKSRILLIPDERVVTGYTASLVMGAFLHGSFENNRFSNEKLGAWYASLDVDTAIKEVAFHSERKLRLSDGGFPAKMQTRELISNMDVELVDLTGKKSTMPEIYNPDPDQYEWAQTFADNLRWPANDGALVHNGIVYDSLRKENGINVCIFWPDKVGMPIVQGSHYEFNWDKSGEFSVHKLEAVSV